MPKQTFFNLPEDKRESLIQLALEEFASKDYDTASISQIVAQAGIAKGSFYQYFADKRDLYQYLLDEGLRLKREYLAQHPPPDQEMDLFDYLRWLMRVGMIFDARHEKLAKIAQRAITGQGPFPPEWGANVEQQSIAFFGTLLERGIASGKLRADLDVEMSAYVFHTVTRDLSTYLLRRLKQSHDSGEVLATLAQHETETIVNQLLDVLEYGMSAKRKA